MSRIDAALQYDDNDPIGFNQRVSFYEAHYKQLSVTRDHVKAAIEALKKQKETEEEASGDAKA